MSFLKSLLNIPTVTIKSSVRLNTWISVVRAKSLYNSSSPFLTSINAHTVSHNRFCHSVSNSTQQFYSSPCEINNLAPSNSTALTVKKRLVRKKRIKNTKINGKFIVFAYGTAEEYDLEQILFALTKQDLYEIKKFYTEGEDVLHVRSKYDVEPECRDIFFFREGSVVMWNLSETEAKSVLRNLQQFEINPYDVETVKNEKEFMSYSYVEDMNGALKNETFYIQSCTEGDLEKYAFSNAMTSSVKLAIWEATLDVYINGLASVTSDLKEGRKIRMSRATVLRKTGELFALKHLINLDSDLLETPDFYWDREDLERLFAQTCAYFSIAKRKRVSN